MGVSHRMKIRHLAAGFASVLLLTGCSPPIVGGTGVGRTADGHTLVHLAVCDDAITTADVAHSDGDVRSLTRWVGGSATKDGGVVTLLVGANGDELGSEGWRVEQPLSVALESGVSYQASGWRKTSARTERVDFTLEDLEQLQPGQILHGVGGNDTAVSGSLAEFHERACEIYG